MRLTFPRIAVAGRARRMGMRQVASPRSVLVGLAFAALALVVGSASSSAQLLTGQLTQLPGTSGCMSDFDTDGACAAAARLQNPVAVTVAPDGKSVYVASFGANAVSVFARAGAKGGRLSQLPAKTGCLGSQDDCTPATALEGASSVAVSPDGRNVYTASFYASAVAAFSRAASGRLTQLPGTAGCSSEDGSGGACTDGSAHSSSLHLAVSVALSPDGRNAYVAADQGIAAFKRDAKTGALTQLSGAAGCVDQPGTDDDGNPLPVQGCATGVALPGPLGVVVSPDGKNIYAISIGFVAVFARSPSGALTQLPGSSGCLSADGSDSVEGACTTVPLLDGSLGIALSPDGRDVYVATPVGSAVIVLARDSKSGRLTSIAAPAGCVSADGSDGQCTKGRALDGVSALAVSHDGKSVYATAAGANAVVAFARGSNGLLRQLAGTASCVSDGGSAGACISGRSLIGPQALDLSPDGSNVYALTAQVSGGGHLGHSGGYVTYDSLDTFRRQLPPPALPPKCKKGHKSTKQHPCRK